MEQNEEATVTFAGRTHPPIMVDVSTCIFMPENGDPPGMARALIAAANLELVLDCYASRFIRANTYVTITPSPEVNLKAMYKYEVYGDHIRAWKLVLMPPSRGFFATYPPGVRPAKERKKYNAPFFNAEWHVFYNDSIRNFIDKYGG